MLNEVQWEDAHNALNELCQKDEECGLFVQLEADYDDQINEQDLKKIFEATEPKYAFDDLISEIWQDYEYDERESLVNEILEKANLDPTDCYDDVNDIVLSRVDFRLPYEHYLNQEVLVDILIDVGDGNYDFSVNQPFSFYGRGPDIDPNSSILWLAKNQGYKKNEILKALRNGDFQNSKFLMSLEREIQNTSTGMNALCFLAKMTLRQLFELHDAIGMEKEGYVKYHPKKSKGNGFIVLDKEICCGLYDPWNGAGGTLEIHLDKDIKIPLKFIDSAMPDGCRGYSIREIYVMEECVWKKDMIKEIHSMKRKVKKDK